MMLTSPFPGMDPYLETTSAWSVFHDWFIRILAQQAMPKAREVGCWVGVERSVYGRDSSGELMLWGEPDAYVAMDPAADEAKHTAARRGVVGVAVADPPAVREVSIEADEYQPHKQEYIVVRASDEWRPVLAVVELLSFANKRGTYAKKYREKRSRVLASMTHFMEIDFLRAGKNPARDLFPGLSRSPYFVFVARQHGAGRHEEGYPLRLQDALPVLGLPLGPVRGDLPLDLAAAFRTAYDLAAMPGQPQYDTKPPPPRLAKDDQQWVDELLKSNRSTR